MKNVVFLAGSFYPDFSAVGFCAYQVQELLIKHVDVTVLTCKKSSSQGNIDYFEKRKIVRLETPHIRRYNSLMEKRSKFGRLLFYLYRIFFAFKKIFWKETIDYTLVNAFVKELASRKENIDVIVPLVFPFEGVIAALEFKRLNPNVKVIPYIFDDFVESGSLHVLGFVRNIKRLKHVMLEKRMLEHSDALLAMHPLRGHYQKYFSEDLLSKIEFLEHPLLSQPKLLGPASDKHVVECCFTGSLIRNVREPKYCLELFEKLELQIPVSINFYTMGNAAHLVNTKRVSNSLKLINHGRVTKLEADQAISGADILINIGEVNGQQISSKIFEYMATGKPIIHFSYTDEDNVTKILSKYPLSCIVRQEKYLLNTNILAVTKFITECCRKRLTFEEVEKIYPEALPKATSELLLTLFKD